MNHEGDASCLSRCCTVRPEVDEGKSVPAARATLPHPRLSIASLLQDHLEFLAFAFRLTCPLAAPPLDGPLGVPAVAQEEANALAEKMDLFLEKFNYSMDNDFVPYVVNNMRNQIPRALKVPVLPTFCWLPMCCGG